MNDSAETRTPWSPNVATDNLIYRASHEHLRTTLLALLATHPELTDQVRGLLGQRPSPLSGGVTTTARLATFRVGWLYREPGTDDWFRIVEIGPMLNEETSDYRNAILEPVHGTTSPSSAAAFPTAIIDDGESFSVKIPQGRS